MYKYEKEIYTYFSNNMNIALSKAFNTYKGLEKELREIRIRLGKPIVLRTKDNDMTLEYIITTKEIMQIVEKLCENSIYAYKKQLCNGFITVKGGHRVGITGTVVTEEDKVINIKYISSLNFRIAREIIGCSNSIIKKIVNTKDNTIFNTLIVSPPGKGKTTVLRDSIRTISNGIPEIKFTGKTCGVVDERGEIAASYHGIQQNDLGLRTDVIENIDKAQGMKILIRTMSPEIIACDEIGSKEDVQAILEAMNSGVKGIFTMHGKNMNDIEKNKDIYELVLNKKIERIIFI